VIDAANGEEAEYRLIGCESDPDSTVVSLGSPIGQALLGRRIGSLVTLKLADGMQRVRIVATHPLGASAGSETA
jgi:transcription elongation GreA/GreB family factor